MVVKNTKEQVTSGNYHKKKLEVRKRNCPSIYSVTSSKISLTLWL